MESTEVLPPPTVDLVAHATWQLGHLDPRNARTDQRLLAALFASSLLAHGLVAVLILRYDQTPKQVSVQEIPVEILVEGPRDKPPSQQQPAAAPQAAFTTGAAQDRTPPPDAKPVAAQTTPQKPPDIPPANPDSPTSDAPSETETTKAERARAEPPPPPPPPPDAAPSPFGLLPGTFRAAVLPPVSPGGKDTVNYKAIVFGMLAKAKRYPETARARGGSGVAVVSFSIDQAGNPVAIALARSSGQSDLDAEVVAMVSRAAPFPSPPQGALRSFSAAIEFGLEE